MNQTDAARMMGVPAFPPGWDFHEIHRGGMLAGFFCTKGNEIHAFRLPEFEGRWLTRQAIEAVIRPLLDQFGELTTAVRVSNLQGHQFVQRLGFARSHDDGQNVYYKTRKVNHARL